MSLVQGWVFTNSFCFGFLEQLHVLNTQRPQKRRSPAADSNDARKGGLPTDRFMGESIAGESMGRGVRHGSVRRLAAAARRSASGCGEGSMGGAGEGGERGVGVRWMKRAQADSGGDEQPLVKGEGT